MPWPSLKVYSGKPTYAPPPCAMPRYSVRPLPAGHAPSCAATWSRLLSRRHTDFAHRLDVTAVAAEPLAAAFVVLVHLAPARGALEVVDRRIAGIAGKRALDH